MILVTGGAGFIGTNFVLKSVLEKKLSIVNLDKLTYAGHKNNLKILEHHPNHIFVHGDIGNRALVQKLFETHLPQGIIHFAAETHVDRSISSPENFLNTNVLAAFAFLEETLSYWKKLEWKKKESFRFLNVSTDEVYGSLSSTAPPFTEKSRFAPNSPYAASKASFDHFIRAFHQTYGLPTITTYCSNNFGPYQYPEKLIPLIIVHALQGKPLPIYGEGHQIRQWIYVDDHCDALLQIFKSGVSGTSYNIGGGMECTNLWLVKTICRLLDELKPAASCRPYEFLIKHVNDRPGHDFRYSLDSSKLTMELGWKPKDTFEVHLRNTVLWYINH